MTTQRWSELSPGRRRAIAVGSVAELILTTLALTDLRRRPAGQVRGPRWLWGIACLVQPIGPIAYLALGRRR